MLPKLLCILITLNCLSTTLAVQRSFNVEAHNTTCKPYSNLYKKISCNSSKLAVGRYGLNVMFELSRQLPPSTEIEFLIHVRAPKGRKAVKFLEAKFNVCDMLAQVRAMPLVKEIVEKTARSSNKPLLCPIKGNSMYNITILYYIRTSDLFPLYTPIVNFNFTLNFFDKKEIIFIYQLQGSTVRKS